MQLEWQAVSLLEACVLARLVGSLARSRPTRGGGVGGAHLFCYCAKRDHTPCPSRLCYEKLPVTLALNNGKADVGPGVT